MYKYIHSDEEFVCSRECVLLWIQNEEPLPSWAWRTKYPYTGSCLRGSNEVWSPVHQIWFASRYELLVAIWLDSLGIRWKYEEIGFPLRGRRRYTPDFFLPGYDCFLEVKGAWISGRKKLSTFRELYPDVRLLVVNWLISSEFKEDHVVQRSDQ